MHRGVMDIHHGVMDIHHGVMDSAAHSRSLLTGRLEVSWASRSIRVHQALLGRESIGWIALASEGRI